MAPKIASMARDAVFLVIFVASATAWVRESLFMDGILSFF
jgi:hypothetical protein